jgi:hypothetical protein
LSAAAAKEISILMLWDIMLSHWASGLLIFWRICCVCRRGFWSMANRLPSDATSHPWRLKSCLAVLWKPELKLKNRLTFRNRAFHIWNGHTPTLQTPHLNICSTNIRTEFFKHAARSSFFSLQNAVYFIVIPFLVPVIFALYIQGVLKF